MKLIDSHCHLNHPILKAQLNNVLTEACSAGVKGYIIPGIIANEWKDILELISADENLYCGLSLHPLFIDEHRNRDLVLLDELSTQKQLVAIGEIGLDYYHGREQEKEQQLLFEQQLDIATRAGLPVILHVRKAHDEVLATIRRKRFTGGGAVHAFNGSIQQAEQYIGLGFAIGVGGAITHDRAKKLRTMIQQVPVNSIILETDSPDMQISGKKKSDPNLPQYLPKILYELARIKQMSPELLAETTRTTTQNIFKIDLP